MEGGGRGAWGVGETFHEGVNYCPFALRAERGA